MTTDEYGNNAHDLRVMARIAYSCGDLDGERMLLDRLALVERATEVERLRDGAALLIAQWRGENSNEFALAAQELAELVADPKPRESLALALARLQRENAELRAAGTSP